MTSNTLLDMHEVRKRDVVEVVILVHRMVGMIEDLRRRIRDETTRVPHVLPGSRVEGNRG